MPLHAKDTVQSCRCHRGARFIAQARSRDVALTPEEVGRLLTWDLPVQHERAHKLALHLLILCTVRKTELCMHAGKS